MSAPAEQSLVQMLRNWRASSVSDGDTQLLQRVSVSASEVGVEIRAEGYGSHGMEDGFGCPIFLELDNDELVLHVWADINQEDPIYSIRLGGAKESARTSDG